jgi:hypothetical protein
MTSNRLLVQLAAVKRDLLALSPSEYTRRRSLLQEPKYFILYYKIDNHVILHMVINQPHF